MSPLQDHNRQSQNFFSPGVGFLVGKTSLSLKVWLGFVNVAQILYPSSVFHSFHVTSKDQLAGQCVCVCVCVFQAKTKNVVLWQSTTIAYVVVHVVDAIDNRVSPDQGCSTIRRTRAKRKVGVRETSFSTGNRIKSKCFPNSKLLELVNVRSEKIITEEGNAWLFVFFLFYRFNK